ncbi:MAG: aminoacyl-tRNA hydrolase [Candidatus Adiutrix sp.]|jgi:PTH1 family peptidyl-tRNA hydrolase|nr:aminoacyl-tRNA hydrolase [Candidatus Adiutrix sp.]
MRLIVGLGNPGPKYERTRHNAGFMALARLAAKEGFEAAVHFGQSRISKGRLGNDKVILAWPQTFMNLSGEAVRELASFHKIPGEHILVMHDDMDIEPGRLKLALGGGAAGHNGLASIIASLPDEFCRLKIGIGRPPKEIFVRGSADYVLTGFAAPEWPAVDAALDEAADAARDWVREGLARTQGRINRKKRPEL